MQQDMLRPGREAPTPPRGPAERDAAASDDDGKGKDTWCRRLGRCLSRRVACGDLWAPCRALYAQFAAGAKELWADARVAWRHKHLDAAGRARALSWRDAKAAREAPGDFLRMLPLLVNPLPPPLGLVLIAVAYRFPKRLLAAQFHSGAQAEAFAAADRDAQRSAADALRRSHALADALEEAADGLAFVAAGDAAATAQYFERYFTGVSAPLGLGTLDAAALGHLAVLARPRAATCCGAWQLRRRLARAARDVAEDDALLAADGLTPAQLRDACVLRAIDADGDDARRAALRRWQALHAAARRALRRPDLPPAFVFLSALLVGTQDDLA